jgi:hypothetical protein
MADKPKPRLVPLDSKPQRTRKSIYKELVSEFANDDTMMYAQLADVRPTAIVSVKKAIATLGLTDITAFTSNGTVVLEKTGTRGGKG